MDRHSEVEVKFSADKVTNEAYHKLVHDFELTRCAVKKYVAVRGTDTFYKIHDSVLRYRTDGGPGCLTYKARKSDESIVDRVEIDLPFSDEVQPRDVHKTMQYLKAKKLFSIEKLSLIYHTEGIVKNQEYEATLALYDVMAEGQPNRRFLEVEVERHNKISPDDAKLALVAWRRVIQKELDVGPLMNEGLFQIYSQIFNKEQ